MTSVREQCLSEDLRKHVIEHIESHIDEHGEFDYAHDIDFWPVFVQQLSRRLAVGRDIINLEMHRIVIERVLFLPHVDSHDPQKQTVVVYLNDTPGVWLTVRIGDGEERFETVAGRVVEFPSAAEHWVEAADSLGLLRYTMVLTVRLQQSPWHWTSATNKLPEITLT